MTQALSILPVPLGIDNVHSADNQVFQVRQSASGSAPPLVLRSIIDMDLESDGKLVSRSGYVTQRELVNGKQLIAKGGMLLVVDGDSMINIGAT